MHLLQLFRMIFSVLRGCSSVTFPVPCPLSPAWDRPTVPFFSSPLRFGCACVCSKFFLVVFSFFVHICVPGSNIPWRVVSSIPSICIALATVATDMVFVSLCPVLRDVCRKKSAHMSLWSCCRPINIRFLRIIKCLASLIALGSDTFVVLSIPQLNPWKLIMLRPSPRLFMCGSRPSVCSQFSTLFIIS